MNEGTELPITAYIDNFEVFLLNPDEYYSARFLDGDENDPEVISISPTEPPVYEQTPTPTPTSLPAPTTTPATPPQEITVEIPNLPPEAKPLEMVLIPAGTFTMGSPFIEIGRDLDEGPQHEVTLTQSFYMGKYEVTQMQWQAMMGYNPHSYHAGINKPVGYVSWYESVRFCNRLSNLEGLREVYDEDENTWEPNFNANGFRLPTEAEWEYACRAGTTTRFYWGDDPNETEIDDYAWYEENSSVWIDDGYWKTTHEVGQKLPNNFGLFDMSGNVSEWCTDWYDSDYYSRSLGIDPVNLQENDYKVVRGGRYNDDTEFCRSASRSRGSPSDGWSHRGFRLVLPETP